MPQILDAQCPVFMGQQIIIHGYVLTQAAMNRISLQWSLTLPFFLPLPAEACGCQVVYAGTMEEPRASMVVEDPQSCFTTINEIQKCVISLEQEHKQYLRMVARSTVIGSRFVLCL